MSLPVRNEHASLQFGINEQSISTSTLLCSVGYTERGTEEREREKRRKRLCLTSLSQNLLPGDQNIYVGIELAGFLGQLLPKMCAYCVFVLVKFK